jgi:hypothetical protein
MIDVILKRFEEPDEVTFPRRRTVRSLTPVEGINGGAVESDIARSIVHGESINLQRTWAFTSAASRIGRRRAIRSRCCAPPIRT